jgi:hypothetical protein
MSGRSREKKLLNPDYKDILSAFIEEGVEYIVVGAYALAVHGLPRATGDIDLWVNPTSNNGERVYRALERFGAPLDNVSSSDFLSADFVLQIGVAPRRIDILTNITAVEFVDAWKRRLSVEIDGLELNVLSRADQITNKRAVGRPQDIADAARLEERRGQS